MCDSRHATRAADGAGRTRIRLSWEPLCPSTSCRLLSSVVKPSRHRPAVLQIVQTYVDVALRKIAVLGGNIGPRPVQESNCHLADTDVDIFNPAAVTAQVQGIEIDNVNVLPPVVSFPAQNSAWGCHPRTLPACTKASRRRN